MTLTPEQARTLSQRVLNDPAWFCREILGCKPYAEQIQIIESVRDNEQTSVNGANGVGKDWMIGRIVLWWMTAHMDRCERCDPGALEAKAGNFRPKCKVIVTAPTHRQISEIVWRETRGAYQSARAKLGGYMLPKEAKWDVAGDDAYALGFSTDSALNVTGFHSPHLLLIVSEAHNFPQDTYDKLLTFHPERVLLSANPFTQSGFFYESHHSKRHLWNAITITALDSPNVKAGEYVTPGVVGARDLERMAEDWGVDSPYYRATVLAEFAETEDGLLPLTWLKRAHDGDQDNGVMELHAGLDLSGPGEDETVLVLRQGDAIIRQWTWRKTADAGEVIAALLPYKDRLAVCNYDSAGLGMFFFQDAPFPVRGINVGEAPRDTEHFRNLKAELYWGLRERFRDGAVRGLTDELAISQLASIRYGHNARGQVQIESKDDARKRGVKSPDRAEAIMLAFAYGDGRSSTAETIRQFEDMRQLVLPDGRANVEALDRMADEYVETMANKEF